MSRLLLLFAIALLSAPAAKAQESEFAERYIGSVLARKWEHKMISSGKNFPSVSVQREHRGDLLILLHERVSPEAIRSHFGWTDSDLQDRLAKLESAGLVRRDDMGGYVPTIMIMPAGDVARYLPVYESLVERTVDLIVSRLPEIEKKYKHISGFKGVPFERVSLLILSDVLLDNWQINAVEKGVLNAERPLRDGARYYYSIQEDIPWDSTEAFGIYGNQYRGYGPYTVGVYGNRRSDNPLNFANLDAEDIGSLFGTVPDTAANFKRDGLAHLVRASRDAGFVVPSPYREGFEALGWIRDGRVQVPVFGDADQTALDELAAMMTNDLIGLLASYRPSLQAAYEHSPYGSEVTFEEYFMWWYHLYYTAVTDRLAAMGHIYVPASGITSYVFAPSGE